MRAVTVVPGVAGSLRLEEAPEPDAGSGSMVVEALAVGICGTDAEIADGTYGWPPPGRQRLVLGHESLGRVVDPEPSGFRVGENVVAIVRRPDPVPCPNCAVGEWDMCSNGGYTERGIKQVDRFMAERWRIEPEYAGAGRSAAGRGGVRIGERQPASLLPGRESPGGRWGMAGAVDHPSDQPGPGADGAATGT
jgi:threonine dehydrogenase-like Zn-dependent dehydrogenase